MKKLLLLAISLTVVTSCTVKPKNGESATMYYNGDIITMTGDKPVYAEAVVQKNGKIVFVGSQGEAQTKFGSNLSKINLSGKTMVPAFLDAHGHFFNVGFTSLCANLLPPPDGPGQSAQTIVNTLNTYKNSETGKYTVSKMGWIIGNGYDDSQLAEKDHPKFSDLDKVSTDIPVVIIHQSGHLAVLNTKALELVGYNKETKDMEGGVIRKDKNGNLNGVLEEAAFFNLLPKILGGMDEDLSLKSIEQGQLTYASKGYLTAQDGRSMGDQLSAMEMAADRNLYYIDVVAYPDVLTDIERIKKSTYRPTAAHDYTNKFRIGGLKLVLDGSPQGKTAWLTLCYHENPAGRDGCYEGYPIMSDDAATEFVKTAYKNQWQIICHSNGDAAIAQFIKAIGAAEQQYGYADSRSVLIHGQTLRKDQIPDLVKLKIIPSLFPMHTFYWGDWHEQSVLGKERASYISPMRDVLNAGLKPTSHHDAPVTMPNSMRVLDATVNRITRTGKILGPDQRLTPYEGLKTLTDWAAIQYFEEDKKGTITEGKLADFVILDKNPLKINSLDINKIEILESIKEGKTVYKKN